MKKITTSLVLVLLPFSAFSGIFDTNIIVNGEGETQTRLLQFDAGQDLFNSFKSRVLSQNFTNYSDSQAVVSAVSNFRGVTINSAFPVAGSTLLTFEVPSLGIRETFEEETRSKSGKALEKYLRRNKDGTLTKITNELIATTPTDPLAGNPASLQGQLVANDFDSGVASAGVRTSPYAVGVGGGTYWQDGISTSVFNIPVSTAFGIDSDDPRKQLLVNGQFNYVTIGNSSSYQGGLGVGYRHPVSDQWYFTPRVSYGVIGSPDLISLGQILSASLTSDYEFNVGDYTFSVANMFGYYKTLPLNVAGINTDPDIDNYVLKNGFFASRMLPFELFSHKLRLKGFFTDTEFFGSNVYTRQYNEIGFQIDTLGKVEWLDTVTFGLAEGISFSGKYIFSIENPDSLDGYDLGLSYDF